jgi:hypothetical protein
MISLVVSATATAEQAEMVRIFGQVKDPTGADVISACVALKSPDSSTASAIRTNEKGQFIFEVTPAATYDLSVTAKGFKSRSLTIRPAGGVVGVEPIIMELSPYSPYIAVPSDEELNAIQAKLHRRGSLIARGGCVVDLDSGKASCPGSIPAGMIGGDLQIGHEGGQLYISPMNGATGGIGERWNVDHPCDSARYAEDRVRIDDVSEGSPVCIKTSEGRKAELSLWFREDVCIPGDISISFVTWKH